MTNAEDRAVLVTGFGNPGRLDDGLGPALAAVIEKLALPGVTVDADYQLTVEDAADVAKYDVVLFVDADTSGPEPFWVAPLEPGKSQVSFSSHSVSPAAVLALARDLFKAEPEAWLLGIRGYEFNAFGEWLSEQARANLAEAVDYVEKALREGTFRAVRPEGAERASPPTGRDSEDEACKTENT